MLAPIFYEPIPLLEAIPGDLLAFYSDLGGHRLGTLVKIQNNGHTRIFVIKATGRTRAERVSATKITDAFRDKFLEKETL